MKSDSRNIKYFDCVLSSFATGRIYKNKALPPMALSALLRETARHFNPAAPIIRINRARTLSWHIADIQIQANPARAIILISRSDKEEADQVISDPEKDEFLVAAKNERQGNAYSSHIVINLDPVAANTYVAVIEDSRGISSKDVAMTLNLTIREYAKLNPDFYVCPDPAGAQDEKNKLIQHKTRYRIDFRGHPSPDFIEQLNGGKVDTLDVVVPPSAARQWDGKGGNREKQGVIQLKPEMTYQSWYDTIIAVADTAKQRNMRALRIKFTDDQDLSHTVEIDTDTKQLLDEDRYVKKARIEGFANRLNTACKRINDEVKAKMLALLR